MPLAKLLRTRAANFTKLQKQQLLNDYRHLHGLYSQWTKQGQPEQKMAELAALHTATVRKMLALGVDIHSRGGLFETLPKELKDRILARAKEIKEAVGVKTITTTDLAEGGLSNLSQESRHARTCRCSACGHVIDSEDGVCPVCPLCQGKMKTDLQQWAESNSLGQTEVVKAEPSDEPKPPGQEEVIPPETVKIGPNEDVSKLKDKSLMAAHYFIHDFYRKFIKSGNGQAGFEKKEDYVNYHARLVNELKKRGFSHYLMEDLDKLSSGVEEKTKQAPDKVAGWDKRYPLTMDRVQDVATLGAQLKGTTVLELGCGGGELTEILAVTGWQVKAIDESEDAVTIARMRGTLAEEHEALTYMQSLDHGSYDNVISFHFLEHNDNWHEILDESVRLARLRVLHVVPIGDRSIPEHKVIWNTQDDLKKAVSDIPGIQVLSLKSNDALIMIDKETQPAALPLVGMDSFILIPEFISMAGSRVREDAMPDSDYDLVVRKSQRDLGLELQIRNQLRAAGKESIDVQLIYNASGPHGDSIPLYDLVCTRRPATERRNVPNVEDNPPDPTPEPAATAVPPTPVGQPEETKSFDKDVLSYVRPLKPAVSLDSLEEIWDQWAEPRIESGVIQVEWKADGIRAHIHKKGAEVRIRPNNPSEEYSDRFPKTVAEVKSHGPESYVIDAECLLYKSDGKPAEREDATALVTKAPPYDDSLVIFWAFDCLHDGKEWLLDLPYSERRKRLEVVAKGMKHVRIMPTFAVTNKFELMATAAKVSKAPGSEGAIFKLDTSIYKQSGSTSDWAKCKVVYDIAVEVTAVHKNEAGTYTYEIVISDGKGGRVDAANTMATGVKASVGNILELRVLRAYKKPDGTWSFLLPRVIEVRDDITEPHTVERAGWIAKQTQGDLTKKKSLIDTFIGGVAAVKAMFTKSIPDEQGAPINETVGRINQGGKGRFSWQCVSGDTYLITKTGLVKIGEYVKGAISIGGKFDAPVRKLKQGPRDAVTVVFENGMSLTCSPDHQVKICRWRNAWAPSIEWAEANMLRPGCSVLLEVKRQEFITSRFEMCSAHLKRNERKYTLPDELSADLAWLLGYWKGDGSWLSASVNHASRGVEFLGNIGCMWEAEKVKNILVGLGVDYRVYMRKQVFRVRVNSVEFADWWRSLLKQFASIGGYFYRQFILGWIQADGSRESTGWTIHLKNEQDAELLQQMCLTMGWWATKCKYIYGENSFAPGNRYCTVYISPDDYVLESSEYTSFLAPNKLPVKVRTRVRGLSGVRSKACLGDFRLVRVKEVKLAGVEELYDLQMPTPHQYLTNGLVSHNCHTVLSYHTDLRLQIPGTKDFAGFQFYLPKKLRRGVSGEYTDSDMRLVVAAARDHLDKGGTLAGSFKTVTGPMGWLNFGIGGKISTLPVGSAGSTEARGGKLLAVDWGEYEAGPAFEEHHSAAYLLKGNYFKNRWLIIVGVPASEMSGGKELAQAGRVWLARLLPEGKMPSSVEAEGKQKAWSKEAREAAAAARKAKPEGQKATPSKEHEVDPRIAPLLENAGAISISGGTESLRRKMVQLAYGLDADNQTSVDNFLDGVTKLQQRSWKQEKGSLATMLQPIKEVLTIRSEKAPMKEKQEIFLREWRMSSTRSSISRAMAECVKQGFLEGKGILYRASELEGADALGIKLSSGALKSNIDALRGVYDTTQHYYKNKGVDTIELYRGTSGRENVHSVLSSWTSEENVAERFDGKGRQIMKEKVPVTELLVTHQTGGKLWRGGSDESEFVRMSRE